MSGPLATTAIGGPGAALLEEAVRRPGLILEAYSRFHGYSFGNQCAALFQCILRGIPPGPRVARVCLN